jgi:hypothetical protein
VFNECGLFVLGEDCCCCSVNDSSKRKRKGKDRENVGIGGMLTVVARRG